MTDIAYERADVARVPAGDSPMLAAALRYAAAGWPIFPCHSTTTAVCSCRESDGCTPGKHPRTHSGFKNATCDPEAVRDWWMRWPDANIGVACGPDSIEVLDFDVKNGSPGAATYEQLKNAGLLYGAHAVVRTPSGGWHLYYVPSGQRGRKLQHHGLDMQGAGAYVIAPPSTIYGKPYSLALRRSRFGPKVRPADFAAIRRHLEPEREVPRVPRVAALPRWDGDLRPGDDFEAKADWGDDLLLGGAGWRFVGQRGRQLRWCRPGKERGVSAVTGGDRGDVLHVFTSSAAPFEASTTYSKFGAYTLLHHNRDYTGAARELGRLGFGTMRAVRLGGVA